MSDKDVRGVVDLLFPLFDDIIATEPYLVARVELSPDVATPGIEVEALRRAAVDLFRRLAMLVDSPLDMGRCCKRVLG